MSAQVMIAISIYFSDIDTLGRYIKFVDNFDATSKPEQGSQTAKVLMQIRMTVRELYQNRDIYHKEKINIFLSEQ
jgi:hypothetical protein